MGVVRLILAYRDAEKRVRCGAAIFDWRVKVGRKARLKLREAMIYTPDMMEVFYKIQIG